MWVTYTKFTYNNCVKSGLFDQYHWIFHNTVMVDVRSPSSDLCQGKGDILATLRVIFLYIWERLLEKGRLMHCISFQSLNLGQSFGAVWEQRWGAAHRSEPWGNQLHSASASGRNLLSQHKLLPSAGKIKFESERGVWVETSCFHLSPSSHFQMEIKLSSNDLYPHGCQCHEEAENVDQNEPQRLQSSLSGSPSPPYLRSMAGEILPATPWLGQPYQSNTDWHALEAGVQRALTS